MRIPSDEFMKSLVRPTLSNEKELQRFIEDCVLAESGLQRISSSLNGRGRLGKMDTTAIDHDGAPIIIEYKWRAVNGDTLKQVRGYRDWLLQAPNRARFEQRSRHVRVKWDQLRLVVVGWRFAPNVFRQAECAPTVRLARVERGEDRAVYLRAVDPGVRSLEERFVPDTKDHYLEMYLGEAAPSARRAFITLERRLVDELKLSKTVKGKGRVTYRIGRSTVAELNFSNDGLLLKLARENESTSDAEFTRRGKRRFLEPRLIATPKDVGPAVKAVSRALAAAHLEPTNLD